MSYRLTTKRLDRITPDERTRLNLLTLKASGDWYSLMRREILHRKKALERIQLFLIRDTDGVIVAWSSVKPHRKDGYIYTYVMQAHRRHKLGTKLINRAINWCQQHRLAPKVIYSSQNTAFFQTINHKLKVEIAGY